MRTTCLIVLLIISDIANIACAQAPDWRWGRSAVGNGASIGNGIGTDAQGNVYEAGSFRGDSITFGITALHNSSTGQNRDVFVVKYDPQGNVLWARSGGGTADDGANGIATDAAGNVYVTGYFTSATITFATSTLTKTAGGGNDFFVVKYDSAGQMLWATSGGDTGDDYTNAISVDAGGNVYVTGTFNSDSIALGNTTIKTLGGYDVMLLKYNAAGSVVWAKSGGGAMVDQGNGLTVDADGSVYLAGYYASDTLLIDGRQVVNAGDYDIFIAKYDSVGQLVWLKGEGYTGIDIANALAADAHGNLYVTGLFASPGIKFNQDTLFNAGGGDIFLVKYDVAGNFVWDRRVGGTGADAASGVTTDADGNVYLTGEFDSPTLTFGTNTLTNAGDVDMIVLKFDSLGNALWAKNAGGSSSDVSSKIVTDVSGNIYVTGFYMSDSVIFGSDLLVDSGSVTKAVLARIGDKAVGVGISNASVTNSEMTVYPNPTTGAIYFRGINSGATIEVYNVLGQVVSSTISAGDNFSINLAGHSKGIYFYRVTDRSINVQQGKIVLE